MDDEVSHRMVDVPENIAIDDNPTLALEPDVVPCHPKNVFPMIQPPIKGQITRPRKPSRMREN